MSDYVPLHYYSKYIHFWDDVNHVVRLLPSPPLWTPSELAGMFDGDGCFYFTGQKQVACALTQCYFPLLGHLQTCFGGQICKRDTKHRSINQRYQYNLKFSGLEIAAIVPILKDHLVLKVARAERIFMALAFYNKTDTDSAARREALMNDTTDVYAFDRINKDYIRGLFCAEGCLRHNGLSIAQKSCVELLYEIQKYVGMQLGCGPDFGTVTDTEWRLQKKADIKLFLDWLTDKNKRPLLHGEKAGQVTAFYKWYRTGKKKYVKKMTALKHEDYDVPKKTLKEGNTVALEFSARLRSEAAGREVRPQAPPAPPLTDEQRALVRTLLCTTDKSFSKIAKEAECTKEQARHLCNTEDIERPNPTPAPEPLSAEQQVQVKALLESKDKELSYEVIAQMVGCNKGQVSTYATLSKAPPRKPGRKPKATGVEAAKPPKPKTGEKRILSKRLNDEEKAKLRRLLENPVDPEDPTKTLTQKQIAAKVECTAAQVAQEKKRWLNEKKKEAEASAASS
jgi:hypothetical protein